MATENQASPKLLSGSNPSFECERTKSLLVKLVRFYSVMGNRPDEPGALALIAEILCQSGTDEQIAAAMMRCTRECRYPVRLPDLLQRMPGQEIPAPEAEARRSWDELMKFVGKYVGSDVYGNCGPEHGWHPENYPKLSDRILDSVRRTGGWVVYLRMTDQDFPFVQKRFLEEYSAWSAVQRVDASKLLTEAPRLHLVSGSVGEPAETRVRRNCSTLPTFKAKPVPQPMTDAQLRDRREMLRQQEETLKARKRETPESQVRQE